HPYSGRTFRQYLSPGRAVPAFDEGAFNQASAVVGVLPDGQGVSPGRRDCTLENISLRARIRALLHLPGRSVPVLDQGLELLVTDAVAHRPGVVGRARGHAVEVVVVDARVRALLLLPGSAVPVLDE